jgi:hypothetical protein
MSSKSTLNNKSSHKRDELISKIIKLEGRIDSYTKIVKNRIRKKRYFYIIVSALISIIYLLSYFDIIILNNFWIFGENELYIVLMFFPLIPISIWSLYKLKEKPLLKDYNSKSLKELRIEIKTLQENENKLFEIGAKEWAHNFSVIFVFSILLIFSIIKNEYFFSFPIIILITFRIARLISSPISSRKFNRNQIRLKNMIINSFLNNLDNSKVNPRKLIWKN